MYLMFPISQHDYTGKFIEINVYTIKIFLRYMKYIIYTKVSEQQKRLKWSYQYSEKKIKENLNVKIEMIWDIKIYQHHQM